jgi:hypothetical protein
MAPSTWLRAMLLLVLCGIATARAAAPADPASKDVPDEPATPVTQSQTAKDTSPAAGLSAKASPPTAARSTVGEPLAPGMMELLRDEIVAGLKTRGVQGDFARFQGYLGSKLYSSSGPYTGSELTGNCRLKWYEHVLRNPLGAPAEAEGFTRKLHQAIYDDAAGLAPILPIISEKLDLGKRRVRAYVAVHSPEEALDVLKQALVESQTAYAAALAPLTKSEVHELTSYLYPVLVGQNNVGHTLSDRGTGRRLCDLMEKMDRSAWIAAAEAMVPLTDPKVLEQLKQYPETGNVRVEGVSGRVVAKIDTPAGAIVIGSREPAVYNLDAMPGVAAVVTLGGNNKFHEGTTSLERPVLVVLNLGGKSVYQGTKPGVQGGAILGVSMVVNLEGGNVYEARDVAQGSCLSGVGIVLDFGGDNKYRGLRRVQGHALGGLGLLIARGRQNDYHAAMWAQGFGSPLGFGLIDNLGGYDHYYCGGLYTNSYKPETPGYEGWGQGVGAGIRQSADGGIGVLLDGGGHNVYEFDYLSHGGGYWCGLGFARDFGPGNQCLICRKNFYGGERTEQLFQRFGCGWGCHYAAGFCFGDGGDDVYEGTIMGTGMGWDCSIGVLCDFGKNVRCKATGGLTQGCGAQASLGILYHYGDGGVYDGYGQGYAPSGISYHKLPYCGGNFSFLVDYGSKNTFGCGADTHSYTQRGAAGGFLISRPTHDEAHADGAQEKPAAKVAADMSRINDELNSAAAKVEPDRTRRGRR